MENQYTCIESQRSVAYFSKNRPIKIDSLVINYFKNKFIDLQKNLRICLHSGPESNHHDMIIYEKKGAFYPPHYHNGIGETFSIIQGTLAIFTYDDMGEVLYFDVVSAGEIYRVRESSIHSVYPLTDYVIYHENKPGPFLVSESNIYPAWCPINENEIDQFQYRIKKFLPLEIL